MENELIKIGSKSKVEIGKIVLEHIKFLQWYQQGVVRRDHYRTTHNCQVIIIP